MGEMQTSMVLVYGATSTGEENLKEKEISDDADDAVLDTFTQLQIA